MNKVEKSIQPHKIYHVNLHPIPVWKWGLWILFLFAVNGIMFFSLFLFYWNVSGQYGPALGFSYSIKLLIISCLVFLVSIILTLINLKKSKQYLTIFQEGIIIKQSKLRKISWKSVKSMDIYHMEHYFLWFCVNKSWKFIIALKNGKLIKIYIPLNIPEKIITTTHAAFESTQIIPDAMS